MAQVKYQEIIEEIFNELKAKPNKGKVATYIPELGIVSAEKFGVYLRTVEGESFFYGDSNVPFSIQSIAKVLSLALAYKTDGAKLWKRVGVEPSGNPFNSLIQLEYDCGKPRNALINAGAIVICDVLMSQYEDAPAVLLDFIRTASGNSSIEYDMRIAQSEKSQGFRNMALVNFIKSFGNIKNDSEKVLDFYFNLCSIKMSCKELAETFVFLANNGRNLELNRDILTSSETKRLNAIMLTCGFYDEAGDFTYKVGLPGKSGVGGGIVAVYPNNYSIAVWSPKLNKKGNSYLGMKFLERFTSETGLSIF
ncbi:glutaminase [Cryomorpha ignava]|uniref:Glutaminase n=1 Tax=Cryomorpha ignava TaxID=101383 RepID=A0A7K3WRT7_9FLAO|nr:glutaminase [Cryomorpha ignava]NEN24238.1 glutaminase [Cryomorpha ignava]